jgi:hypothetical protein
MTIKYKIFRLDYNAVETFAGYSDGYGKEHEYHPVLKPSDFFHWFESDEWDTVDQAELAIEKYGNDYSEYVIQKIYCK